MALPKWAEAAGQRFAEAAVEISNSDICSCLADCLRDLFPGQYCYPEAVFGDDESGDVVYYCAGDMKRAPYTIDHTGDNISVSIDTAAAYDVYRITTYVPEAGETGVGEAERFPGSKDWKDRPLTERFISKAERDSMDKADFAGDNESFPINRKSDVMAAVRSIGRGVAGGQKQSKLKANIKKIATRKGFGSELPDAWTTSKIAAANRELELVGDVIPLREGAVGQDGTAYLKLIAPGWGSSGYYSEQVLQRDGAKAFPSGTKNFWNHQTSAEEAARPEGDLRDLASVLTEDAHYEANGPAGAGLYAKANVQPHFREHVDSLAKHIGMSIRASGRAKEGKADGKSGPIIEQLTRGISVDYVTTPGAGGKILQLFEAARGRNSNQGETDMDEATVNRLIEAKTAPLIAENKALKERLGDIDKPKPKRGKLIRKMLEGIRLSEASKDMIVEAVKRDFPLTEAGAVDEARLKVVVEREIRAHGALLESYGAPKLNLGASAAVTTDVKAIEAADKQHDADYKEAMGNIADIFLDNTEETDSKVQESRRNLFMTKGRAA